MQYPFKDWSKFKRGFTFKQKYPAWVGSALAGRPHLGLDVMTPLNTPLEAPCAGTVVKRYGKDIGNAIYLDTGTNLVRFLHLNKVLKTGKVEEGDLIGLTGNTGLSSGPHCHIDASKIRTFSTNINNYIDPEVFFYPKV